MSTEVPPKVVAIVGGSGSGKSWLVARLMHAFSPDANCLSLDNFYFDLSHVAASKRDEINFDDPGGIEWDLVELALRSARAGQAARVPRYDFATHTRADYELWRPKAFVFVDGLWLLQRPRIRGFFDFKVFLACPEQLRWERRLTRDVTERGRRPDSVREQFWTTVAPMHQRHVEPQAEWADFILQQPPRDADVSRLIEIIRERAPRRPAAGRETAEVFHPS